MNTEIDEKKKMNTPLFSVLIPAYNIESFILQTLESALSQTIRNIEIIVVDDGSTDNTTGIVNSLNDNRIRLIHQPNSGVSVARNRAIAEAQGKYVAFLDGDDIWLPGHLETALHFFEAHPEVHWYSSSFENRHEITKEDMRRIIDSKCPCYVGNYFVVRMQDWTAVWTSAIVMERNCIPELLFPPGIVNGEDDIAWAKFASYHLFFGNCSAVTVYYRQRQFSASTAIMGNRPERFKALLENAAFYSEIAESRKFDFETTSSLRAFVAYAWEQSISNNNLFLWPEYMTRTRNLQSLPLTFLLHTSYWSHSVLHCFLGIACKILRRCDFFK